VLLLIAAAEPRSVSVAGAALERFAASAGAPARVRAAIAAAVMEACTNVVLGARAERPGTLELRASRVGRLLVIDVADPGAGATVRMSFRVP
jgi:anti-sigma regulatory factor (Ser/Thr protein kinase)